MVTEPEVEFARLLKCMCSRHWYTFLVDTNEKKKYNHVPRLFPSIQVVPPDAIAHLSNSRYVILFFDTPTWRSSSAC